MFEELGLNIHRQEDNGSRPRPDNRSGWLAGEAPETPDVVARHLEDEREEVDLGVRLWDPSTQLRFHKKRGAIPPYPDAGIERSEAAA
jgi:biotin synthase